MVCRTLFGLFVFAIMITVCGSASGAPVAASPADAVETVYPKFLFGGDIRLREVYFDNIPYTIGGGSPRRR